MISPSSPRHHLTLKDCRGGGSKLICYNEISMVVFFPEWVYFEQTCIFIVTDQTRPKKLDINSWGRMSDRGRGTGFVFCSLLLGVDDSVELCLKVKQGLVSKNSRRSHWLSTTEMIKHTVERKTSRLVYISMKAREKLIFFFSCFTL